MVPSVELRRAAGRDGPEAAGGFSASGTNPPALAYVTWFRPSRTSEFSLPGLPHASSHSQGVMARSGFFSSSGQVHVLLVA